MTRAEASLVLSVSLVAVGLSMACVLAGWLV